ncbi:MAG: hypothetical protein ACO2O5_13245 [Candidatus Caldipriscus sp.]
MCKPQKPRCEVCPLTDECPYYLGKGNKPLKE